jgi:pimeloyl-ACP methyl ester carboxylesterase
MTLRSRFATADPRHLDRLGSTFEKVLDCGLLRAGWSSFSTVSMFAHLVGYFYGRWYAPHAARRAPDRVASLALLEPAGFAPVGPRHCLWGLPAGLALLGAPAARRLAARWLHTPSLLRANDLTRRHPGHISIPQPPTRDDTVHRRGTTSRRDAHPGASRREEFPAPLRADRAAPSRCSHTHPWRSSPASAIRYPSTCPIRSTPESCNSPGAGTWTVEPRPRPSDAHKPSPSSTDVRCARSHR